MLELKESLAEWKSMPYLLNMDDSSSNSVANASTAGECNVASLLHATVLNDHGIRQTQNKPLLCS